MKASDLPAERESAIQYRVTGMDCPDCVAKIERAVRSLPNVESVKVSLATGSMVVGTTRPDAASHVEQAVTALGYRLQRADAVLTADSDTVDADDDDRVPDLTHAMPSYRRALWIVVFLNVVYGAIEIVGGFFAGSQAVKADALDFIGDGLISFLGLLAIGWGLAARARAALLQGLFLAMMGIGVLAVTVYRFFVMGEPAAELMGLFGVIALVVNVLAAVVLLPHRTGDANVRAVWLFSRNDALGNLAVVIAAGLVAWTKTPWPDLVVAAIIAALFLQSAVSIIRDARSELREVQS